MDTNLQRIAAAIDALPEGSRLRHVGITLAGAQRIDQELQEQGHAPGTMTAGLSSTPKVVAGIPFVLMPGDDSAALLEAMPQGLSRELVIS